MRVNSYVYSLLFLLDVRLISVGNGLVESGRGFRGPGRLERGLFLDVETYVVRGYEIQ